jgi:hypothetical protein
VDTNSSDGHWYPPTRPQGVKIQMTTMDIFTAIKNSNLIHRYLEDVE